MVEAARREPTMQEIVVALRETKDRAGKRQPLSVVGNPAGGTEGVFDIAGLRDREIERLLAENAELNQRIVSLLKLFEREQARQADATAIGRVVKETVAAELRPVMLSLLRLLEKRHGDAPETIHQDNACIVDLDGEVRQ